MIPFFSSGPYIGPIARALGGADIAMTIGLPVAALAYVLLYRSVDLGHERLLIVSADRDLEPSDLEWCGHKGLYTRFRAGSKGFICIAPPRGISTQTSPLSSFAQIASAVVKRPNR
jgi:hypothetical protein